MVVFYGVNEPKGGFRIFQFLAIHGCKPLPVFRLAMITAI